MFLFAKLLGPILLPPGIMIALLTLALFAWLLKRRAAAAGLATLSLLLTFLFSFTPFSNLLIAPLESRYAPLGTDSGALEDLVAVVVLGGGFLESSPEEAGAGSLSPIAMKRALYGLELAEKLSLPLIYSGGNPGRDGAPGGEAAVAGRLWARLGFDPARMSLEGESRDTAENAAFVKGIAGRGRIVLVTSAAHMPRSMMAFQGAGVEAIPAPTDYRRDAAGLSWLDFLPSAHSLETSSAALHEYLGLVWYRIAR